MFYTIDDLKSMKGLVIRLRQGTMGWRVTGWWANTPVMFGTSENMYGVEVEALLDPGLLDRFTVADLKTMSIYLEST